MAAFLLIFPAGISLFCVLLFSASISASAQRLKPIAAFLANTIHSKTSKSVNQLNVALVSVIANVKPIIAKGNANIVCEKVTKER